MSEKKAISDFLPDTATEPGAAFFQAIQELSEFLRYLSQTPTHADSYARMVSDSLLMTGSILTTAENWLDQEHKEIASKLPKPTPEQLDNLKRIREEGSGFVKAYDLFQRLILEMALCRAVDDFVLYLAELMTLLFQTRPETLKSSNEKIDVKTILDYQTMEELIAYLVERRVIGLSFESMRDLSDFLAKNDQLGFQLFPRADDFERAICLVETRNLLVHNRGIVSRLTLKRAPNFPAKLGDHIKLDAPSVEEDTFFLTQAVVDIDQRAASKWGLPQPRAKASFS